MNDFKSLKRRQQVIKETMMKVDDMMFAKSNCTIVIPFRYVQAGLLDIGSRIYCATVFPILNNNGEYGVSNYCSKMEITCNDIEIIKVDGDEHYFFKFQKGDTICPSIHLVKDDTFSYNIYDEFIQKANAPWFLNYRDLGTLMMTSKEYAGVNLADTNAIFEIIVASLTRNRKDVNTYYRESIKDLSDEELSKHPMETISYNSVAYAAINNMNKLMGGYIEDGLTSALTNNESARSGIEEILRKQ